MGWKASIIFVNSEEEFNLTELFGSLGYFQLQKYDEQYFDSVMNPDNDKIYIGKFHGNTIICMQDLPLESLDEKLSNAEKALSMAFKNSEVVTLILHSVVNLWGYSVVKDGKKIRVRAGSSDGTFVEFGEVLKEEEGLMSQSKTNDDGERVFIFDDMPDEEFTDDQVGENFVFNLSAKYFGETLDTSDELFETKFIGYTFSRTKPKVKGLMPKDIKRKTNKSWWKFWT